jgi:hypothetical protein
MEIDTSWHDWKKTLGRAVNTAEFLGMSDENINKTAYRLRDFLAANFDPGNREQRLLKELWDVGSEEEQKSLAKMIAKMVDKGTGH